MRVPLWVWLGAMVVCVIHLLGKPRAMVFVRSSTTGKEYEVRRGPDAQRMADRLGTLELRLVAFLDGARRSMPGDPRIATIVMKWDGTLAEVEAQEEVAFSVDKSSISLCLRNAATGQPEDMNSSMFVLLHELAHIATSDYGHSTEFWSNMRFLLELAEKLGMYEYQDYSRNAATYCGHPLGSSPLTCVKQRTCTSLLRP